MISTETSQKFSQIVDLKKFERFNVVEFSPPGEFSFDARKFKKKVYVRLTES